MRVTLFLAVITQQSVAMTIMHAPQMRVTREQDAYSLPLRPATTTAHVLLRNVMPQWDVFIRLSPAMTIMPALRIIVMQLMVANTLLLLALTETSAPPMPAMRESAACSHRLRATIIMRVPRTTATPT